MTDEQAAVTEKYVELSVENMITRAENEQLKAQLAAKPAPAPTPAPETPTYPMTLEDGRIMYGSWNDLADPFVDKFNPRNNPNDVAYQAALKDRDKFKRDQALANMPKLAPDGIHELDENGEMIPTPHDLNAAQKQAAEKAWLEPVKQWSTRETWKGEPYEILNPDEPEDHESNDPNRNGIVAVELHQRERARSAAYTNVRPRRHRNMTGPRDEMRELGLLPPLVLDKWGEQREAAKQQLRAGQEKLAQSLLEHMNPQAKADKQADKQKRINELLIKGDMASRKEAQDIMDGRVP